MFVVFPNPSTWFDGNLGQRYSQRVFASSIEQGWTYLFIIIDLVPHRGASLFPRKSWKLSLFFSRSDPKHIYTPYTPYTHRKTKQKLSFSADIEDKNEWLCALLMPTCPYFHLLKDFTCKCQKSRKSVFFFQLISKGGINWVIIKSYLIIQNAVCWKGALININDLTTRWRVKQIIKTKTNF